MNCQLLLFKLKKFSDLMLRTYAKKKFLIKILILKYDIKHDMHKLILKLFKKINNNNY